jgi:hypothetical protein
VLGTLEWNNVQSALADGTVSQHYTMVNHAQQNPENWKYEKK